MFIMGAVSLVSGIMVLHFPEPGGCRLPETMDEAINVGKNYSTRENLGSA